jgi:hypothetical protein
MYMKKKLHKFWTSIIDIMACAKSLRRYDELVTISKSKSYGEHAGDAMVAAYARRR